MAKVSLIIPSRTERFLGPTVRDVLANARGDIEVLVVLDGYWTAAGELPDDKRVIVMHRGSPEGMRPAINWAASAAKGEFLMKLDAHCSITEGFDVKLQEGLDKDWVVVPRRDRLDPIGWCKQETGKIPIDAHYLSWPWERPNDPSCGLHGTVWNQRSKDRSHILIDDEMSSQGSCWFMHREHFEHRIGPLDVKNYGNFIQEFQEIGLKTWLGTLGGRVIVNKNVTYLHLHKGRTYGRGYSLSGSNHEAGARFCTDYWMNDRWPDRVRNLRWLVEKFSPVPTWPIDLDLAFRGPSRVAAPWRQAQGGSMKFEIIEARYGVGDKAGEFVDVTEVVKGLTTEQGFTIDRVRNEVLGVGNPFQGKRKRLTIRYSHEGVERVAEALERKSLTVPQPPAVAEAQSPVPSPAK
jgi:glycosyltransferase involved in cell wall biosynthesis